MKNLRWLPLLLLLVIAAISFRNHVLLSSGDKKAYHDLLHENNVSARHALEGHPIVQKREQVQKDFWMPEKGQRLHIRLNSNFSELILHERNKKIEAVERLRELECVLQERIDPDGFQEVRHLTASGGVYFYPSQRFFAEAVFLDCYHLPGILLPEQLDPEAAYLIGTAKEADFTAWGKTQTFSVRQFDASFNPLRGAR